MFKIPAQNIINFRELGLISLMKPELTLCVNLGGFEQFWQVFFHSEEELKQNLVTFCGINFDMPQYLSIFLLLQQMKTVAPLKGGLGGKCLRNVFCVI